MDNPMKTNEEKNTAPLTISLSMAYPNVSGNFLIPIICLTLCLKVEVFFICQLKTLRV